MDNTARENNYNEPSMTNIVIEAPVQAQVKGDAKSFRKYGLLSLVFAIVYTFCLYKNKSGITYPIFMAITFGLIYAVRKSDDLPFLKDKKWKSRIKFILCDFIVIAISYKVHVYKL